MDFSRPYSFSMVYARGIHEPFIIMQIRLYNREEGNVVLGGISARLLKDTLLYHVLDYVVQYSSHVFVAVSPQRVGHF